MQRAVKGVAVRGINIGDVRALQVALPSRAEQREIVRQVEELFALVDSLQRRYEDAESAVEKLTPSVLAKGFRGELVPQDPTDEPAPELLQRIGSSRAASARSHGLAAATESHRGKPGTYRRPMRKGRRIGQNH
jgi:type I restriction enzyme S subunit